MGSGGVCTLPLPSQVVPLIIEPITLLVKPFFMLLETSGQSQNCFRLQSRNQLLNIGCEVKNIVDACRYAVSGIVCLQNKANKVRNDEILSQVTKNGLRLLSKGLSCSRSGLQGCLGVGGGCLGVGGCCLCVGGGYGDCLGVGESCEVCLGMGGGCLGVGGGYGDCLGMGEGVGGCLGVGKGCLGMEGGRFFSVGGDPLVWSASQPRLAASKASEGEYGSETCSAQSSPWECLCEKENVY
ncbi:hypothetical protein LWI28_008238 [Acer negundo]|uniref:Uncharacterized protein n=1 Tax=Acer negundo TaxID=4023 RepID=A0AAD5P3Z9_ACENE|nr:hypothetical protein LWI28_008238 [Acer negundo]